jgi:hemoglobin-like flavoprotein
MVNTVNTNGHGEHFGPLAGKAQQAAQAAGDAKAAKAKYIEWFSDMIERTRSSVPADSLEGAQLIGEMEEILAQAHQAETSAAWDALYTRVAALNDALPNPEA